MASGDLHTSGVKVTRGHAWTREGRAFIGQSAARWGGKHLARCSGPSSRFRLHLPVAKGLLDDLWFRNHPAWLRLKSL